MKKLLIGSSAIKQYYKDFPREPKDIDYAINEDIKIKEENTEYLYNPVLFKHNIEKMSLDDLLTLKVSHLCWDINWDKHMFDTQFLIKRGHKINKELFYDLYEFWNIYHGKNKRSDLKMTSAEFFNNAVKCPYNHDFLHTLIKETPTYTKILKDGEEVDVSEEKFNQLSYEEKKSLVQEEIMVMAYERNFHKDYRFRYGRMLKKFIISHAPIWEMLFIVENYLDLCRAPYNFMDLIDNKLKNLKEIV